VVLKVRLARFLFASGESARRSRARPDQLPSFVSLAVVERTALLLMAEPARKDEVRRRASYTAISLGLPPPIVLLETALSISGRRADDVAVHCLHKKTWAQIRKSMLPSRNFTCRSCFSVLEEFLGVDSFARLLSA
jgi:hypothetical protein